MKTQSELIGNHPSHPNSFNRWLLCNDVTRTPTKCHRSLTEIVPCSDSELIEWLAKKLIDHHYSDFRLRKLKEKYKELGFPQYAEQHRKLPIADKTRKGNAIEILLTEYVEGCLDKKLVKVFKLKYNPNVDQAIKGDDTLMVDIIKDKDKEQIRLYLGEAKFRKKVDKNVVKVIGQSLAKDKKPISYSFLVDELAKNSDTEYLAEILDKYIVDDIKGKGDLIYTGFLLSDTDTHAKVEAHLESDNPELVFISVGIDNPEDLVIKAFEKAEEYVLNPAVL